MNGSKLKVKAGGKQPVRLRRLRRRRRPATLMEKPSQKRASQRKLESPEKLAEPGDVTEGESQKVSHWWSGGAMDGGWRILIGGSADDARSGWSRKFTTSLWEGFSGASRGIQTASTMNQHATRFRVARQLSQGAGVRRKPEDQPRLDWRTQGTEVGGRQAAGASRRWGSQPSTGNWSPA